MNKASRILNGRWTIPAISGSLIVLAFVMQRVFDTQTAADMAMVAAAVVGVLVTVLSGAAMGYVVRVGRGRRRAGLGAGWRFRVR